MTGKSDAPIRRGPVVAGPIPAQLTKMAECWTNEQPNREGNGENAAFHSGFNTPLVVATFRSRRLRRQNFTFARTTTYAG